MCLTIPSHEAGSRLSPAPFLPRFSSAYEAGDTSQKDYGAVVALKKNAKFDAAEAAAQALVAARTKALGAEGKETLRARLLWAEVRMDLSKEAEMETPLRELLPLMAKNLIAELARNGMSLEQFRAARPLEEEKRNKRIDIGLDALRESAGIQMMEAL